MKAKSKLKIFIQNCEDEKALKQANNKLECIDNKIQSLCSARNVKIVEEYLQTINCEGKFSHTGTWKLRKKLHPAKTIDPPMAKLDRRGNIVTAPNLIRKLYLDTYIDRLRQRKMNPELLEVFNLKTELWKRRQKILKSKVTPRWSMKDLNLVLKSLKNNKSRDPHGLLNDIFKPGLAGRNLKLGILHFVNGIKSNFYFPQYIQWANITTIYKSKGSRMSLESDRGIFVISVLKRIIDKLIYNDKYEHIDNNMSDSNIGGRRNKNIKNHLFIIHGIINAAVKGDTEPVDIQIYDIQKAFNALWLDESMNDLYDTVLVSQHDDKLALLYEGSKSNMVAINTAVGQTERVHLPRIVMQGGTWGPIKCSNSIDKIGKTCQNTGSNYYLYKNRTRIFPLGMVDDLLSVSACGHQSVAMNSYLTTQCELKKLSFHIPDENGKTKCHQMHIGRKLPVCPELKIHGHKMEKVTEDKYLGDILSSTGSNTPNLRARIARGIGKINEIISILETISFGHQYFRIVVLLREALFLNSILTNVEVWYGLKSCEISELEDLDRNLLRRAFKCPITTPKEACHLELGLIPISCILKARRANYLHYLVNSNRHCMLYKFFITMYENPSKDDWTEQVEKDLNDLGICMDFEYLRSTSKPRFKSIVKNKCKEMALDQLNGEKFRHSKMNNIVFTELKMQAYLVSEEFTLEQKRNIFLCRTRMADYSENYRAGADLVTPCIVCKLHTDSLSHAVNCIETLKRVKTRGNWQEIYTENISIETAIMLSEISEIRKMFRSS